MITFQVKQVSFSASYSRSYIGRIDPYSYANLFSICPLLTHSSSIIALDGLIFLSLKDSGENVSALSRPLVLKFLH